MTRLNIELPIKQHQAIKALAALRGQSIREYVLEKILPQDNETKEFNHLTLKALEHIDKQKNLKQYKNLDELFENIIEE